ncbi:orotidine-5'-phosphate decarboxylase [Marisediminicola senii]|uniref:orotidine-5'-phosphate decarboxylase n=1 Tax=Marisediminicola senii TaxID=2711233 RepID=UPI0019124B77|nr:orotidine-5'-phosphate decarboxylase [Marisediminicola senii]
MTATLDRGAAGQRSFGQRLDAAFDATSQLCVGIDPHPHLLQQWGLADDAAGVRDFAMRVVDAAASTVGIVKPQVAFFERHGARGYAALEEVIGAARAAGLLVIADVKRGDVGTSVEAYAQAWLTPGSPLESDAITLSAFQGVASNVAPFELAEAHGKGLFVLAATSNPEAVDLQTATTRSGARSGMSVAAGIVADVREWNEGHATGPTRRGQGGTDRGGTDRNEVGSIGLVIGATVDLAGYGIDRDQLGDGTAAPILAPGFGHQGARYDQLPALFGRAARAVVVSASRSILSTGPDGIATAIRTQAAEVTACRK